MPTYSMAPEQNEPLDNGKARFTVFGVGGGGGNAVEHMVTSGISGVTFVCANTDKQALDNMSAPHLIQLGAEQNRGLGAGADPEVGKFSAENEEERIRELLNGSDMVFITAGMGGGTGTGASPVIARIAKEMNVLTVAVVTIPFSFEGKRRGNTAKAGIEELAQYVDSIITIPNDKLLKVYGNISMVDAYKKADDILLNAVKGIADMIINPGFVNLDFNDLRAAMTARGHAMMGIGRASGDDRARQATEMAIRSPLLDDVVLQNAKGLIVNVTSAGSFTLLENQVVTDVAAEITDIDSANMFFGNVFDETMGDEVRVTVIATGLSNDQRQQQPVNHAASNTATQEQSTQAQPPVTRTLPKAPPALSIDNYLQHQHKK